MEILKPLLLVYSVTIVVNFVLMLTLWKTSGKKLYLYAMGLWAGVFANFLLQGIFDQNAPVMILSFATYYVCSLIFAKIMELTTEIKIPYSLYHGVFAVALISMPIAFQMELNFTEMSLPVAIAVAFPMLHTAILGFFKLEHNPMAKVYASLLLLNGLHFLDYPFLRPLPEMAVLGFSLAFVLTIMLSVFLPIYTSKIISERYAKLLQKEIDEHLETEKHLRLAKDKAIAADKAKTEFLNNISHELRTPMNGLLGISQLLREKDLDGEIRSLLDIIDESANRLHSVLGNILDYSSLEKGELSLVNTSFNLAEMIDDIFLTYDVQASQKGLNLNYHIEKRVPQTLVADEKRLKQVLINLLSNAVKFTESGEVKLQVAYNDDDLRNPQLVFSLQDTGIGIAPDKINMIFDAFNQADGSSTRQHGGTGLGLSISRELVELMGGTIRCQSEPGQGSVFEFTLPLALTLENDDTGEEMVISSSSAA